MSGGVGFEAAAAVHKTWGENRLWALPQRVEQPKRGFAAHFLFEAVDGSHVESHHDVVAVDVLPEPGFVQPARVAHDGTRLEPVAPHDGVGVGRQCSQRRRVQRLISQQLGPVSAVDEQVPVGDDVGQHDG